MFLFFPGQTRLKLYFLAGGATGKWCACKDGVGDGNLQKTLDYACGNGADCNPIRSNGPCYNPNTVKAHCNYAVNSYFQKKGQGQGSCEFAGTAAITTTDPSNFPSLPIHLYFQLIIFLPRQLKS